MNSETTTNSAPVKADFTKTIWVSKKELFLKKVKHLNRILAKHGKEPIAYTFSNTRSLLLPITYHILGDSYRNDRTINQYVEVCDVHCTGLTIVKKDDVAYSYLGTVTFEDGVKQVFCNNENYGRFFMDDFRPNYCDHCHTTRTNRKTYFLFCNSATNEVVQIGSTCAKEYFGIDSIAFLEAWGDTFLCCSDGTEEELGDFKKGSLCVPIDELIPVVSLCTAGFLKWHKASDDTWDIMAPLHEQPTTQAVQQVISSWNSTRPIFPEEGDRKNASLLSPDELLSFWLNCHEKDGSTFSYNCKEAVKAGYATFRSLGVLCYAIFAAYNAKVKAIREAEINKNRSFVPCAYPVGSRQTLNGTVTNIRTIHSEACYDGYHIVDVTKYVVDFTETNGTLYHFCTSSSTFHDVRNGMSISLRATIGQTNPFKGVPYTAVSRPTASLVKSNADVEREKQTA